MCFWIQTKKDILTKLENNLSKYSHKKRELEKVCKVKKERAHGGCLGTRRRRRTRLTAKCYGEQ